MASRKKVLLKVPTSKPIKPSWAPTLSHIGKAETAFAFILCLYTSIPIKLINLPNPTPDATCQAGRHWGQGSNPKGTYYKQQIYTIPGIHRC